MTETEGVIKYQLHHTFSKLANTINLTEINHYRSLAYDLELIGQNPLRYLGYGYGNISQRIENNQFLISGTQTGEKAHLSSEDYCLVTEVNLAKNSLHATGQCKPSSETLTHASVYMQHSAIHCVIHAHTSIIWHATNALKIPHTAQDIPYGTPDMAEAVADLVAKKSSGLFTMLGHEDGVIAYGEDFSTTLLLLTNTLNAAKQI